MFIILLTLQGQQMFTLLQTHCNLNVYFCTSQVETKYILSFRQFVNKKTPMRNVKVTITNAISYQIMTNHCS